VDDHRIIALEVEDSDLKQLTIPCGSDQHCELAIPRNADCVANRVEHVLVSDLVLASRLPDSHRDRIPCQTSIVKEPCQLPPELWIGGPLPGDRGYRILGQ
jgi:hypothetical protein